MPRKYDPKARLNALKKMIHPFVRGLFAENGTTCFVEGLRSGTAPTALCAASDVRMSSGNEYTTVPSSVTPGLPFILQEQAVQERVGRVILPPCQRHELFQRDHALVGADVRDDVLPLGFVPALVRIPFPEDESENGLVERPAVLPGLSAAGP